MRQVNFAILEVNSLKRIISMSVRFPVAQRSDPMGRDIDPWVHYNSITPLMVEGWG